MEFTDSFLDIKLTEIFKVKFCTNYEKIIHIVPNLHAHTHTHTHTSNTLSVCDGYV